MKDKTVLFSVADGPEGIEIYSSEEEAIVDCCEAVPAVYLVAAVNGANVKLGPFFLVRPERVEEEMHKKAFARQSTRHRIG